MSSSLRNLSYRVGSSVYRQSSQLRNVVMMNQVFMGRGLIAPVSSKVAVYTDTKRFMSLGKMNGKERKRLRSQRVGKNIFIPAYVNVRDQSRRLGITVLQQHKAGATFFPWWPRASEKQLKKDGYNMLRDLILRFDECAVLCQRLGFVAIFEHTGLERIRNEHYNIQGHLEELGKAGYAITPQIRQKLGPLKIGHGTGPRPLDKNPSHIQPKQPVVCIVGHVDHGKTTLLDRFRGTFVAAREDAGITQDLYSYQADLGDDVVASYDTYKTDLPKKSPIPNAHNLEEYDTETQLETYKKITFLDTPGHASFFDMRENGVLFCDAVVLVVSAVDGVCSQTLESLEYIKQFNTPVIVALTKCDVDDANPRKVIRQLREAGLFTLPHDDADSFKQLLTPNVKDNKPFYKTQIAPYVCISALHDINMDVLKQTLMKVFLTTKPQCDMLAPPVGLVLEALNEEGGRGKVLRVLLSSGMVSLHDSFISGIFSGKIKDIREYGNIDINEFRVKPTDIQDFPNNNREKEHFNVYDHILQSKKDQSKRDRSYASTSRKPKLGEKLSMAIPGIPIELMGCEGLPQAGDDLRGIPNDVLAKTIAETRRFEMEYPEQGRFTLGGLKPVKWKQPKLVFLEEAKKQAPLDLLQIEEITHQQVEDKSGTIQDVDTDQELDHTYPMEELSEEEQNLDEELVQNIHNGTGGNPNEYETWDEEELQDSTMEPDWDTTHTTEPSYERPFIIKAGKAGYLRMIIDSIKAFNETFPEKKISIIHSSIGSLNMKDIEKASGAGSDDGSVECPILLYRTKVPLPRILSTVKHYPTTIYEYAVFDDLIKHMIGEDMFKNMYQDSQNLRLASPGTNFMEEPSNQPDSVETTKLKTAQATKHVDKVKKLRSSLTGKQTTPKIANIEALTSTLLPPLKNTEEYDPVREKAATIVATKILELQQLQKPKQFVRRSIRSGGLFNANSKMDQVQSDINEQLETLKKTQNGQQ